MDIPRTCLTTPASMPNFNAPLSQLPTPAAISTDTIALGPIPSNHSLEAEMTTELSERLHWDLQIIGTLSLHIKPNPPSDGSVESKPTVSAECKPQLIALLQGIPKKQLQRQIAELKLSLSVEEVDKLEQSTEEE